MPGITVIPQFSKEFVRRFEEELKENAPAKVLAQMNLEIPEEIHNQKYPIRAWLIHSWTLHVQAIKETPPDKEKMALWCALSHAFEAEEGLKKWLQQNP